MSRYLHDNDGYIAGRISTAKGQIEYPDLEPCKHSVTLALEI